MAKYNVYTRISTNISAEHLLYDLKLYRYDSGGAQTVILDVAHQQLQSNYETQKHETLDTSDGPEVIYLMDVMLYRKSMMNTRKVLNEPFTRMFTLSEFQSGKACAADKRENACYFETVIKTQPVNQEENIFELKISSPERAFIAKNYPVGSIKDPFEKSLIENQIASRLKASFPTYPDQGGASLCGPAAYFYCLQMDRPDVYAQTVRELWRYGKTKIGNLDITPGEGCRHPGGAFYNDEGDPRILGIDWITLASLRDSENSFFNYDNISDKIGGITMGGKLREWFEKSGYELVMDNVGLNSISEKEVAELNKYVKKGYKVATLISGGLLNGSWLNFKSHWIVWESEAVESSSGVKLKLFSWGSVFQQIPSGVSMASFSRQIYGGLVFKPLK